MINVYAQKDCSTADLRKAYLQARDNSYNKAIETLNNSLKTYPNCTDAYIQLSEWYYRTLQVNNAIKCLQQCYAINTKTGVQAVTKMQKLMQSYKEDSLVLQLFTAMYSVANSEKDKLYFNMQKQSMATVLNYRQSTNRYTLEILDTVFNNINYAVSPSMSAQHNKLYYIGVSNKIDENFFEAIFDSCIGWLPPKAMPFPPNTPMPERSIAVSLDHNYLFFTRCDNFSDNGWDGGGCDAFFVFRENDSTWSSPQKFGATINSPAVEIQPCLASNNKTMYFASSKPGGYGGLDLYLSNYEDGYWQEPINLGPNINTTGNESAPFIHADGKSLYFLSDYNAIGGRDIFYSSKKADSIWQKPINLATPINSLVNEEGIWVSPNGIDIIIAAQNAEDNRKIQLFKSKLPTFATANNTVMLHAQTIDKADNSLVKGMRLQITDTLGNHITSIINNEGDASINLPLPNYSKVVIVAKNTEDYGFKPQIDTITLFENKLSYTNKTIKLKLENYIDTLYKFNATPYSGLDTCWSIIAHNKSKWLSHYSDTVHLFIDLIENIHIDTTFKTKVSFSEEGLYLYNCYVDSLKEIRHHQFTYYATWVKKYLDNIGYKNSYTIDVTNQEYFFDDRLLQLKLKVVEFY